MRPHEVNKQYQIPKPTSIKEVPSYIIKLIKTFFVRLFYIYKLVWEARPSLLFVMTFMSVFNGVSPVFGAYIGAEVLNTLALAFTGELSSFDPIIKLLVINFVYLFLINIVNRVYNMVTRISGEVVSNHIKMKIVNKAKDVDLASFDSPEFYAKLENANREAGSRPVNILSSTFSMISSIISLVSFVVILFAISPWAPFIIVLMSIPITIVNFVFRNKNVQYMWWRSKDRRQMNYYSDIVVNKDLVKEVKLFGLSDTFIERYKQVFKNYFAGIKKLIVDEGLWSIGATVVSTAVNCGLFIYIAKMVFEGILQVGDYSLYTGALNSISGGVTSIITTTATIYEGTLFINNMISYMNEQPHVVSTLPEPRKVERHVGHTIVFDHVYFKYPGTEKYVLEDVNLTINAGDTVVIVGLNGAGKTTLIKLLTRLYDPSEGTIYLDGHDIKEYNVEELYKMYGIIFQDFGKYAMNVKENIQFGQIDAKHTMEAVSNAAEAANATDFINRLPDGFETPLMRWFEENGIELSIGQWQKLAIARAFYSDSDILILDEPTASLDPMAEQEIFNQFDNLRKDKTTFFVSHRLSSATQANKIVVLEHGKIIEVGNHSQLMNLKGKYYELFSTQAQRYITPVDETDTVDNPHFGSVPHMPPHPDMAGQLPHK
ncbi:MAG: ABC transporter ATP-binding protein [Oscillospiraceae bacterium]|nr:ABC transporter ATP-binding protein [Oscillospiraceae bacterium]